MRVLLALASLSLCTRAVVVRSSDLEPRQTLSSAQAANVLAACKEIAGNISSSSAVFYPPTIQYITDNLHYSSAANIPSACAFEPATDADVAVAFKVIAARRVPFAVKSGGHSMNKGFAATTGVLIALSRFGEITYDATANTATFGLGLRWDAVYSYLEQYGVAVLGGRVSGVGSGGFSLAGGYGWRTNMYGLTIDNILSHRLVMPNGTVVVDVSPSSDLGFLLRGGLNNAGLVTQITMRTHPSGDNGQVWGGSSIYDPLQLDKVLKACSDFDLYNADPKASVLCNQLGLLGNVLQPINVIAFYDAATPPTPNPFVNFTKIPALLPGFKTRSFTSLVQSAPTNVTANLRYAYNSIGVQSFTPAVMASIKASFTKYGASFLLNSGILFNLNPEPFVSSTLFTQSTGNSLYPHSPANIFKPLEINLGWTLPTADAFMIDLSKKIAADLAAAARADGQQSPDYALADAPLESIYGDNVARGRRIAAAVDPDKVMSLTGGYRLQ